MDSLGATFLTAGKAYWLHTRDIHGTHQLRQVTMPLASVFLNQIVGTLADHKHAKHSRNKGVFMKNDPLVHPDHEMSDAGATFWVVCMIGTIVLILSLLL